MPAWISGDVQNLSEGEEFISEEDSQKRIIMIFLVLSTFLNSFATSFTVICMELSNSPIAKKEWITPDLGTVKEKSVNTPPWYISTIEKGSI